MLSTLCLIKYKALLRYKKKLIFLVFLCQQLIGQKFKFLDIASLSYTNRFFAHQLLIFFDGNFTIFHSQLPYVALSKFQFLLPLTNDIFYNTKENCSDIPEIMVNFLQLMKSKISVLYVDPNNNDYTTLRLKQKPYPYSQEAQLCNFVHCTIPCSYSS